MLPGEADAAVDLGVELGVPLGGRHGHDRGDGGGDVELLGAVAGRLSGVPHRRGGQLGGDQHVGAVVLDRLVGADRATELQPLPGVGRRLLGALPGEADRLGGEEQSGVIGERRPPVGDHVGGGAVEGDAGGAATGVEVGRHVEGDAVGRPGPARRADHRQVVADRHQHDVGERARHRGDGPVQRAISQFGAPAQRHGADEGALGQAGQQPVPQVVVGDGGQRGAGHDGRHERPRRQVPTHLLDDHHQLGKPEPRAPVRLGQVEAEPAQPLQLVPEGGAGLLVGLEQVSGRSPGVALGEEPGGRLGQADVVVGDGDRHGRAASGRRGCGTRSSGAVRVAIMSRAGGACWFGGRDRTGPSRRR